MAAFSIPTLPNQLTISGQAFIPAPPEEEFDRLFGGFLPKRQILDSPVGKTAYYLYPAPSPPSEAASSSPRRVILLHGTSTPSINLIPLVQNIHKIQSASSQPIEILLYDHWGHGLSSTPLLPHTPSLSTYQLLHLMTHLQWPKAHLMGYSGSASIVISFAAYHPELCSSVTLVAPAGLLRSSNTSYYDRIIQSGGPFRIWEQIAVRNLVSIVDGGQPLAVPAETKAKMEKGERVYDMEAVQAWQRASHHGHMASIAAIIRGGALLDMHPVWKRVAEMGIVETMVVLGESDGIFPKEMIKTELQALDWKGDLRVVNEVGHSVPRQKPAETAELLMQFWTRVDGE